MSVAAAAAEDTRSYTFGWLTKQERWSFVPINGLTHMHTQICLERWEDHYVMCRVMYSRQQAQKQIDEGTSEDRHIAGGVDLYCVFDERHKRSTSTRSLVTIYKPHEKEALCVQSSLANHPYKMLNLTKATGDDKLTYGDVRECCQKMLSLPVTPATAAPAPNRTKYFDFLAEFVLVEP